MARPSSRSRIPADNPKASAGNFDRIPADVFDKLVIKTGQPRAIVMETFGERAAIREYLGNMPRVQAELRAIDDVEAVLGTKLKPYAKGARYVPDGDGHW